jgi:hypothetical protein
MDVKNPVDKAAELADEADRGRSERTPWIALGGVGATIAVVVAVLLVIVFAIYFLV